MKIKDKIQILGFRKGMQTKIAAEGFMSQHPLAALALAAGAGAGGTLLGQKLLDKYYMQDETKTAKTPYKEKKKKSKEPAMQEIEISPEELYNLMAMYQQPQQDLYSYPMYY